MITDTAKLTELALEYVTQLETDASTPGLFRASRATCSTMMKM